MQKGKIPPHGKALADLQRQGLRPNNSIYIFAGLLAWQKAAAFSYTHPERTLCLPPWQSPANYHWPVRDCCVLIFDTLGSDVDYIDSIAACVFRDGAQTVRFIQNNFNLIIYDKDPS